MKRWKTISKKVILDHSKYLKVEEHTVKLPDGRIIEKWPWIISPDFINVLAFTKDKKFLIFKQNKYALKGSSLAPVGGYIDTGESPLKAAKRELLEETGYKASKWINLGRFVVGGNRGMGKAYFYLAMEAEYVKEPKKDDLEEQILLKLSLEELEEALLRGRFKVLTWSAVVSLALNYLKKEERYSDKEIIRAAGGILWKGNNICLIHRIKYDDWTLPKGKLKSNERWEEAAIREVEEETGFKVSLGSFFGSLSYIVDEVPKIVLFWNMSLIGKGDFKPTKEVNQVRWLPIEEAVKVLNYPTERELILKNYKSKNSLFSKEDSFPTSKEYSSNSSGHKAG
jgi:ADP-ribose pyrophosphatase